jgi:gliding motility-associated-like protein
MSDKTPFERSIQESLQGYQAPYDPSAWEGIEAGLDRMENSGPKSERKMKKAGKWTAIALGSAALIGGSALLLAPSSEESKNEEKAQKSQKEAIAQSERGGDKGDGKDPARSEEGKADKGQAPTKTADAGDEDAVAPSNEVSDRKEDRAEKEKKAGEGRPEALSEGGPDEKEDAPPEEGPKEKQEKEKEEIQESSPFPSDLTLRADRKEGCPPLEVSFELEEELQGIDHFWDLGDGTYSNKATPTHRYTETGEHDVTLTLTDRSSGRTRKLVEEDFVTVNRPPEARIEKVSAERRMRKPRPITVFELRGARGVENIAWELGDGTRIEGKRKVEHRYPSKGAYQVRAYLIGAAGCKDTVRYRYEKSKSFDLLAPNSFRPNGNGRNDYFIPEALKILDVPFTMTVHDRSGRVVYKTRDASDPWNGRVQNNGEKVEDGSVFLWVVVLENEDGEEETYKGQVTVIR